jgi:hypothetical protein
MSSEHIFYSPRQNVHRTQIAYDFSSRKTRFLYFPTIYIPMLTDNLPILLKRTNPWPLKSESMSRGIFRLSVVLGFYILTGEIAVEVTGVLE